MGNSDSLDNIFKDVNKQDSAGNTALISACKASNSKLAFAILNGKPSETDINIQNKKEQTALLIACEKYLIKVADKLIDLKADVDVFDKQGMTPLMYACINCASDLAIKLIDNGANVKRLNKRRYWPLAAIDYALRIIETCEYTLSDYEHYCSIELIKRLINANLEYSIKKDKLLYHIIKHTKREEYDKIDEYLCYLIDNGAEYDYEIPDRIYEYDGTVVKYDYDTKINTFLQYVCAKKYIGTVFKIVTLNKPCKIEQTKLLKIAIINKCSQLFTDFLNLGFKINYTDKNKNYIEILRLTRKSGQHQLFVEYVRKYDPSDLCLLVNLMEKVIYKELYPSSI